MFVSTEIPSASAITEATAVSTSSAQMDTSVRQVPPIGKPIVQEFVPPALNKFRQRITKGRAKARALPAAELAEKPGILESAAGLRSRLTERHKQHKPVITLRVQYGQQIQTTQNGIAVRSATM